MSARRPPYWTVPALFAVLLAPAPWGMAALLAAVIGVSVLRVRRHRAARRAPEARMRTTTSVVLGVDKSGRALTVEDRELAAHALILGASGAGKSTTLLRILTDHIRRGRGVVAIDMKGSPAFALQLAEAAAAAGRPFKLWTLDGPSYWNPLQHGNATELKDKLIATERFTEPHYKRAAERYVQTVLKVLRTRHPERPPTLEEVVRLMDPQRLPGALRGLPAVLAEPVQDYIAGLTPDQLSAIRGLQTRLAILTESHTGRYLGSPDGPHPIDLRQALRGPDVVLFSLNSSTYGQLAGQIGTLVVQDLVCAVGDRLARQARGDSPEQATIGIDEFSALGADHVVSLLARGREAGVGIVLATQEMADLDRAAYGLRDQVLGNTAIKIAHRQDVPSSAQTVAQMAGTQTAWEETRQIGGTFFRGYDTGRGTRREVEQFVVHPNEIKSLRTGDAVVISKLRGTSTRTVRVSPPERSGGIELG